MDFINLLDGEYLITSRSKIEHQTLFLIIKKEESNWAYGKSWEPAFHSAEFQYINWKLPIKDFSTFYPNVGKYVDKIKKYIQNL